MSRVIRLLAVALAAAALLATLPGTAGAQRRAAPPDAQRRAAPRHPPHPEPAIAIRGHVFIGGYFYDPFFGPYPWWPRTAYPWYFPAYDLRAEVRLRVEPEQAEDAAVYVDGFYAGVVDDFDGVFQSLPLTPGGHTIVLYLEGYRTVHRNFYLSPGSSLSVRATLERLPEGETSEVPEVAPPVPAPPPGTYRAPVTPSRGPVPGPAARPAEAAGFGTLDLFVQPVSAEVIIDGQRWLTSEEGHFVIQVPAGRHRVEVSKSGYRHFTADVDVREGGPTPLNVSLIAAEG